MKSKKDRNTRKLSFLGHFGIFFFSKGFLGSVPGPQVPKPKWASVNLASATIVSIVSLSSGEVSEVVEFMSNVAPLTRHTQL